MACQLAAVQGVQGRLDISIRPYAIPPRLACHCVPAMTADVHPGGLYDGQGRPVGDTLPYWGPSLLDPNGPRQQWTAVWPQGTEWDDRPALIWLAPVGPFEAVPGLVVAELVAAVDAGRSVILWGSDADCLVQAGQLIGGLAGGGHA